MKTRNITVLFIFCTVIGAMIGGASYLTALIPGYLRGEQMQTLDDSERNPGNFKKVKKTYYE